MLVSGSLVRRKTGSSLFASLACGSAWTSQRWSPGDRGVGVNDDNDDPDRDQTEADDTGEGAEEHRQDDTEVQGGSHLHDVVGWSQFQLIQKYKSYKKIN